MLNNDDLTKNIGKRLKELRADVSMDEECNALNQKFNLKIGKGMMSRWETGKSQPSNIFLCAYALHHDVDLNYLIGLSDNKKPLNCNSNLSVLEVNLLSDFRKLNAYGKNKACEAVHDLTDIARYTDPLEEEKTGTSSS